MWGVRACAFCCETLRTRNHIVYEDAKVIAMLDHNPRAKKHILVIPHEHIPSVDDLTPTHYDLLEHMLLTGKEILAKDGFVDNESCRFGFHRSPFASVPHLHMHCLGLPFLPSWNRLRYMESMVPSYISAESALAALRAKRDALDSIRSSEELSTASLCAITSFCNASVFFPRGLSAMSCRSSSSISGSSRVRSSNGISAGLGVDILGTHAKCCTRSGISSFMFSSCLEITMYWLSSSGLVLAGFQAKLCSRRATVWRRWSARARMLLSARSTSPPDCIVRSETENKVDPN